MTRKSLIIATRESPLALWQANCVKDRLSVLYPDLDIQLLGMSTQADRKSYQMLHEIGGKGLFVKELEEALLDGRADCAVHSMKDVPMNLPEGLHIPAILERENPRDALVSNRFKSFSELPKGSCIGTSSLRRAVQVLRLRPDLVLKPCRGNVNTRLAKLDKGEYDAILLAAAGLLRLNFDNRIQEYLPLNDFLPQAGQASLGIECRSDDHETSEIVEKLSDKSAFLCLSAERTVCRKLNVGCQTPVAVFAELSDQTLLVSAMVASVDAQQIIYSKQSGSKLDAEKIALHVADDLLSQGASAILKSSAEFRWNDGK